MYDVIAENYSKIFPLDPKRVSFVSSLINTSSASILDVGCATGDLSIALAKKGHHMVGIDLNQKMIKIAKHRQGELQKDVRDRVEFLVTNMMDVDELGTFDAVVCFGNTLPHLSSLNQIRTFFEKVFNALDANSSFVLQVLNYHKVLREGEKNFPVVDREDFTFKRTYENISPDSLEFNITVVDKNSGETHGDKTILFPVLHEDIVESLKAVGFAEANAYKDYAKSPSDLKEFATLYVASKGP